MQLQEERITDKTFLSQVMKTQMGAGMLDFHAYYDILYNLDGRIFSSRRRLRFTPKEIAWYPFLSKAEWVPELLNVGTWKFPNTKPGFEHETFRLVAQCINQLRHSPVHRLRLLPPPPPTKAK